MHTSSTIKQINKPVNLFGPVQSDKSPNWGSIFDLPDQKWAHGKTAIYGNSSLETGGTPWPCRKWRKRRRHPLDGCGAVRCNSRMCRPPTPLVFATELLRDTDRLMILFLDRAPDARETGKAYREFVVCTAFLPRRNQWWTTASVCVCVIEIQSHNLQKRTWQSDLFWCVDGFL